MTSPEWAPEREVTPELAGTLIGRRFPELRGAPVERLATGWDNTVFLVGGDWVFRFPRRQMAIPPSRSASTTLATGRRAATTPGASPPTTARTCSLPRSRARPAKDGRRSWHASQSAEKNPTMPVRSRCVTGSPSMVTAANSPTGAPGSKANRPSASPADRRASSRIRRRMPTVSSRFSRHRTPSSTTAATRNGIRDS